MNFTYGQNAPFTLYIIFVSIVFTHEMNTPEADVMTTVITSMPTTACLQYPHMKSTKRNSS